MADADDIQTRLARLRTMRDSGVTSMSHDGVQTSFRSLADLNQLIQQLERQLGIRKPRSRARGVFMGRR